MPTIRSRSSSSEDRTRLPTSVYFSRGTFATKKREEKGTTRKTQVSASLVFGGLVEGWFPKLTSAARGSDPNPLRTANLGGLPFFCFSPVSL